MTDTAVRADETAGAEPTHPLDPATAAEYLAGRDILAAAGRLTGPVRFAYYGLEEPPKGEVLANTAADRRLRAFLVNRDTGESTDVVVSLTHPEVVTARRIEPGQEGQMPILDSDYAAVDEITKADADWRAAMARRGYHDVSQIRTAPITAGAYGPPEDDRRRMVRVLAFVQAREHDLAWAHPIDGVAAYVDLVEKKVFKVTDEFALPVPTENGDYDDEAVRGPHRTTLKPIEITQPEGPSFTLDGHALRWQDWSMRIGFDAREGLSLHQVSVDGRLPAFIAGDYDIDGANIVLWHTFGPTHVPRPEDWPVMPVARCGFVLKPTGFFDRNPTLDVPPPAGHCSAG